MMLFSSSLFLCKISFPSPTAPNLISMQLLLIVIREIWKQKYNSPKLYSSGNSRAEASSSCSSPHTSSLALLNLPKSNLAFWEGPSFVFLWHHAWTGGILGTFGARYWDCLELRGAGGYYSIVLVISLPRQEGIPSSIYSPYTQCLERGVF